MKRDSRSAAVTDSDQRRQLARLRFDGTLEMQFRRHYEDSTMTARVTVLILGMTLIALTPLYDGWLLQAPDAFRKISRLLQFGVQIPAIALALFITLRAGLRRWSVPATLGCSLITACGLMAQHIIGRSYGFNVPHDFAAITIAAMLIMGRIRFWVALPWATLTMTVTSAVAIDTIGRDAIYDIISTWMLFSIASVSSYLLEHSARQSWYRGRLLELQATRDSLTGLPNRRHFDLELRKLVREGVRQKRNVALLILDIDAFKAYNDHLGHPTGDQCLRIVGDWLATSVRRPQDFAARLGGEEFAAVWFDANPGDALRLAEQLRRGIEDLAIVSSPAGGSVVTASGGFAQIVAPSPQESPDTLTADLIKRADSALYAAKRAGRARLIASELA